MSNSDPGDRNDSLAIDEETETQAQEGGRAVPRGTLLARTRLRKGLQLFPLGGCAAGSQDQRGCWKVFSLWVSFSLALWEPSGSAILRLVSRKSRYRIH